MKTNTPEEDLEFIGSVWGKLLGIDLHPDRVRLMIAVSDAVMWPEAPAVPSPASHAQTLGRKESKHEKPQKTPTATFPPWNYRGQQVRDGSDQRTWHTYYDK